MRIPIDRDRIPRGFTLSVDSQGLPGRDTWYFTFQPESRRIQIHTDSGLPARNTSFFLELQQKLRNIGLEIDDTILNAEEFTGLPERPTGIDEYA
jgi:hypothetical protein